ncbi:MAG: family hydrolase [Labilithrix sp.]|nr:family hydrolase [Labilithrix sp.]
MNYEAIATDYDGTLAEEGAVRSVTLAALERLRASGRKLVLVTGRELDELLDVFPAIAVFDSVVAENGAVLYTPPRGGAPAKERTLAPPPPPAFAAALRARGAERLSCGRVIVATWVPYDAVALEVIREQGLELELIFNKGAVMILPSGVNKATGLAAALAELGLSAAQVVGVGDGENDHSLLRACGLGVAVANAVPALKEHAHLVTTGARGDGIIELCDLLVATDGAGLRASPAAAAGSAPAVTP